MQPTAPSVVQNKKVEQDSLKNDDHCTPADPAVVVAVVLFMEVPDLGSMVVVVLVEPILLPRHHTPAQPLDTGTAAEEVVVDIAACKNPKILSNPERGIKRSLGGEAVEVRIKHLVQDFQVKSR
ncbi:hypothetical protein L2E82_06002 [Cichorium intybus]|uniref:Uncharacterized protein n=1 Tax=Cichorium intybus TaxID=13427 RepID=A0ACB9HB19_CICIN|nr:hypothetical protein L2E82_06002 [Cichorium intybus]